MKDLMNPHLTFAGESVKTPTKKRDNGSFQLKEIKTAVL